MPSVSLSIHTQLVAVGTHEWFGGITAIFLYCQAVGG